MGLCYLHSCLVENHFRVKCFISATLSRERNVASEATVSTVCPIGKQLFDTSSGQREDQRSQDYTELTL